MRKKRRSKIHSIARARRARSQQAPGFRLSSPPQFAWNVCRLLPPPAVRALVVQLHATQLAMLVGSQSCNHANTTGAHRRFASSCSGVAGPTTSLATTDGANANANATAGSSTSNWAANSCHLSRLSTISGSATCARGGGEVVCKSDGN